MQCKRLTDVLSVSAQIAPSDLAEVRAAGFRSVICNRPDGEASDQVPFVAIRDAAIAQGLEVAHQPVVSGKITDQDVVEFDKLVRAMPKPVFAYCRTGTRCEKLWERAQSLQ